MPVFPTVRLGDEVVPLGRYMVPALAGAVLMLVAAVLEASGASAGLVIALLCVAVLLIGFALIGLALVVRRARPRA